MHFVYILKCSDNTYYTGCTINNEQRIKHHNDGLVQTTKSKLPVKLITYITFTGKNKAFDFEKHLKSGYERAFAKRHFR
jgi:putative endonuclease